MILVTKPFLPDLSEYQAYVSGIWERNYLTNNGPLVCELEEQLKDYLQVHGLMFTSNGTISIQIALKALELQGAEIITTPFSYVATTSSIVWEHGVPVFADIDPHTYNIDPQAIEKKITKNTKAILATHVFGNPCNLEAIAAIAEKHNLHVIYDAAHAFGVEYKGRSVLGYGDVSSVSFHATKLFHTIEGGALITADKALLKKMQLMRNFGHNGFDIYNGVGINGKNSEFHAAMGLCNLKHVQQLIEKRKQVSTWYAALLKDETIQWQAIDHNNVYYNYAYLPLLFENEKHMLAVKAALEEKQVYTRRYFYPSLNKLDYLQPSDNPVSDDIAGRILCLPIYHDLKKEEVELICEVIVTTLRKNNPEKVIKVP
jgi:dTDP-4-amino-4,6-dideoxygalactose transaminase